MREDVVAEAVLSVGGAAGGGLDLQSAEEPAVEHQGQVGQPLEADGDDTIVEEVAVTADAGAEDDGDGTAVVVLEAREGEADVGLDDGLADGGGGGGSTGMPCASTARWSPT